MAKMDQPSFFEKHVEKIVLLLAGAILAAVLTVAVVSSPHTMPVGAAAVPVPPGEIDEGLKDLAIRTERGVSGQQDKEPNTPTWAQEFERRLGEPFDERLDSFVNLTDGRDDKVPLIDVRLTGDQIAGLHPIPPLGRTYVRIEHELVQLPPEAEGTDQATARDLTASHVTAVLDYGRMVGNWRGVFRRHALELAPTFLRVVAERQELLEDGTWGATTTVSGARATRGGIIWRGATAPGELPPLPDLNADSTSFERQLEPFTEAGMQQTILAPDYYPVFWPAARAWGGWMHHLPVTPVNELPSAQIRDGQLPAGSMGASGWTAARIPGAYGSNVTDWTGPDVFDAEPRATAARPGAGTDLAARNADRLAAEGYKLLEAGDHEGAWKKFEAAENLVPGHRESQPGKEAVQRARYLASLPRVTPVPELANQCQAGLVQLWVHDPACQPGKTYRYRLRLVMLNPLFRQRQARPEDARQMTLTATSDLSAPVQAPPLASYYAVGGSSTERTVKFEIYRMAYGQQMRQTDTLSVGKAIGSSEARGYVDPISGERSADQAQINFATGCILVDVESDQPAPAGGVGGSSIRATLLQPDGTLVVRNDLLDNKDKQRRALAEQAKQAAERFDQTRAGGLGQPTIGGEAKPWGY